MEHDIFVDQGLDKTNIITHWVQKNGSGLHHMAYLVDKIAEETESWEKAVWYSPPIKLLTQATD